MDLELLKTFLEVHRMRHFGRAAQGLFVTPSAVSARIRQLEEQLGVRLFTRTRNNIELTPAGERLLAHAQHLVSAWERASYDILAGAEAARQLSILAVPSLWDAVLLPWVAGLRRQRPDMLLRLEAMPSGVIWRKLQQNQADLGFTLEPHAGPELEIQESAALELALLCNEPLREAAQALGAGYVMVDWGGAFMMRHSALFPDAGVPSVWASSGHIAYELLLSGAGRACYLPESMAREALQAGRLQRVAEAPVIRLPVYAAYALWSDQESLLSDLVRQNPLAAL